MLRMMMKMKRNILDTKREKNKKKKITYQTSCEIKIRSLIETELLLSRATKKNNKGRKEIEKMMLPIVHHLD